MSSIIYKYKVQKAITMPKGSVILTTQVQNGEPMIWAQHDTMQAETETRRFQAFGTGERFSTTPDLNYIGTCQVDTLVWHIFELLAAK